MINESSKEETETSSSHVSYRHYLPSPELHRPRSSSTTALASSSRPNKSRAGALDETQSQQINMSPTSPSPSRVGRLKRAFSFQFGKAKEVEKLDQQALARIKMRYKDVAKFVIWPECRFPDEINRGGYVTYSDDKSKKTAIRYNHAGNHQSAVLRLTAIKWSDTEVRKKLLHGELDASAFVNPEGFKQGNSKFYHKSPSLARSPSALVPIVEENAPTTSTSNNNQGNSSKRIANIEDDQTPTLPNTINRIRRSESSDEEESIIGITQNPDEVFVIDEEEEGQEQEEEEVEPDIQILKL